MKTLKISTLLILSILTFSCSKAAEEVEEVISESEAVEIIASALTESGLTTVADQSAEAAQEAILASNRGRILACSYSESETITKTSSDTLAFSYNCTFSYNYDLICKLGQPDSLSVSVSYEGDFDGSRLGSEHGGSGNLYVSGLQQGDENFIINGNYARAGSFQSKVGNLSSGSNTVEIIVSELSLGKVTKKINSGSASVNISGTVTEKGDFEMDANVVFDGNGSAKITINGTAYDVNLKTGSVD